MDKKKALEILGLSGNPTEAEIKKAYKKASSKAHPDKDTGSTEKMQEVNEARDFLMNPPKEENLSRGPFYNNGKNSDFYKRFFRGGDMHIKASIDILDVAKGCTVSVGKNSIPLKIVPGEVTQGKVFTFEGEGGESSHPDADNGNLYVHIEIVSRDGIQLLDAVNTTSICKIPFETAIYGGKVDVKTPKGVFKMGVRENTGSFQKRYRLTGKGLTFGSSIGDHYVDLEYSIPNVKEFEQFVKEKFDIKEE